MIEFKLNDNELHCSFCAHLDTPACNGLSEALNKALADNKDACIVFDMNGVEYISSAFLRICIMTAKNAGEENFRIINAAPAVRKVLKMARLEDILNLQ